MRKLAQGRRSHLAKEVVISGRARFQTQVGEIPKLRTLRGILAQFPKRSSGESYRGVTSRQGPYLRQTQTLAEEKEATTQHGW